MSEPKPCLPRRSHTNNATSTRNTITTSGGYIIINNENQVYHAIESLRRMLKTQPRRFFPHHPQNPYFIFLDPISCAPRKSST